MLPWLAGFLDGEGSFMLQLRKVKTGQHIVPEMQVTNTHKASIDHIAAMLAAQGVGHHIQIRQDKRVSYKTQFVLRVAGMKRMAKLVDLLSPYLFTKAAQAELVRQFIRHRLSVPQNTPYGAMEFGIYEQIRAANKRGTSEAICQAPNVVG